MKYKCKYCEKLYASYQSRCNHIRKYHPTPDVINCMLTRDHKSDHCDHNNDNNIHFFKNTKEEDTNLLYKCSNCDKSYSNRHNKWRHEKTCKNNNNEISILKKQNEEIIKQNQELKDLLQKTLKIHPKKLQKINNQLNNINNGTINNNFNTQIIQLGKENLSSILNNKEKMKILNRQAMSLNDLIELVHTSDKYNQFKNVYITNLQSSFGYKFDENTNTFIAVNKNELLNDIIESRMYDIEEFYEELQHIMNPDRASQINKFIERMRNDKDDIIGVKKEEIKLILYNNRSKIKQSSDNQLEL